MLCFPKCTSVSEFVLRLLFLFLLHERHEGEGSEKWHGMESCWFPLFGVFLSQKAPACDKGYESWDVPPPHLVLRRRRRYSGKNNHSVWFVLLNNSKKPHKTPQNQILLVVGITFSLNPNKRGLIVFLVGKKPSTQASFCGTWSRGRTAGERKRFVLCFYLFFCLLGFVFIGMLALPGTYFCGSDLCIVKHSQRLPFLCLIAVSLTSRYFSSWMDKWIFPSYWQLVPTLHSYKR